REDRHARLGEVVRELAPGLPAGRPRAWLVAEVETEVDDLVPPTEHALDHRLGLAATRPTASLERRDEHEGQREQEQAAGRDGRDAHPRGQAVVLGLELVLLGVLGERLRRGLLG